MSKQISIFATILKSFAIMTIVILVLGSTLFSLYIVKRVEKKDHERIEQIEKVAITLSSSLIQQNGKFDKNHFVELIKNLTGFETSLYDKNHLIASSLTEGDPIKSNTHPELEMIEDMIKEYREDQTHLAHRHKHFTVGNLIYMNSYYLLSYSETENPSLLIFTSRIPEFYELRNNISLLVAIFILLLMTIIALFMYLLLRRHLSRPAEALIKATEEIGEGNLDITLPIPPEGEMAQLAQSLSLMKDQLKEIREKEKTVNEMKSEILSIASHHLRTPVSSLIWSLDMLLSGDYGEVVSKPQKDILKKIYKSSKEMSVLINDLLDVARIEEGRFGFNWTYAQIEPIIEQIISEMKPQIKKAGAKISYRKPSKELPKIKMDPIKLHLAIMNLLDNAIKYASAGQIKISLIYEELKIILNIEDNGLGIPKEEQKLVFTKFFRGSNIIRKQITGTGLGLFIVESIIEKHGGKIWFSCPQDKGCTFSFSLPVEKRFAPKEKYLQFLENLGMIEL